MGLFWALVQLPMLFATSLWTIVACRVLLGIGEGPASAHSFLRRSMSSQAVRTREKAVEAKTALVLRIAAIAKACR